jgi:hypothetical protein
MKPKPEIPNGPVGGAKTDTKQDGPMFAWTGRGDGESRDVSKPVAFDEHGNPLYAPRGFVIAWPGQG